MWNDAFQHLTTGRRGQRACLNGRRFTLCRNPAGDFHLYDHEDEYRQLADALRTELRLV